MGRDAAAAVFEVDAHPMQQAQAPPAMAATGLGISSLHTLDQYGGAVQTLMPGLRLQ